MAKRLHKYLEKTTTTSEITFIHSRQGNIYVEKEEYVKRNEYFRPIAIKFRKYLDNLM